MAVFGSAMLKSIQDELFRRFSITACYTQELEGLTCSWGFRFTQPPRFISESETIKPDGEASILNRCYLFDAYVEVFAEFCCELDISFDDSYLLLSCYSPDTATLETVNGKTYAVFNIGRVKLKIDKVTSRKYNITNVDINCVEHIQGE